MDTLTFSKICQLHDVDPCILMRQVDIIASIVDKMLCEEIVTSLEAEHVLRVFSALIEKTYTLDNVYVVTGISTEDIASEVARTMRYIQMEEESCRRVLYGLKEAAKHRVITNFMQSVGEKVSQLGNEKGDEAVHLLFDQWCVDLPDSSTL